jgi:hypothetical protein
MFELHYTNGLPNNPPHFPPLMLSNLVYEYYMNNKAKIPDGWAMPDDLAKKVSKALNRKPITPKDEL